MAYVSSMKYNVIDIRNCVLLHVESLVLVRISDDLTEAVGKGALIHKMKSQILWLGFGLRWICHAVRSLLGMGPVAS